MWTSKRSDEFPPQFDFQCFHQSLHCATRVQTVQRKHQAPLCRNGNSSSAGSDHYNRTGGRGCRNLAQLCKTGALAAALGRISHPGILHHLPSLFPAAWSYKQCIITYQQTNQVSSHKFRVQRTGFWLCVFLRGSTARHPSCC